MKAGLVKPVTSKLYSASAVRADHSTDPGAEEEVQLEIKPQGKLQEPRSAGSSRNESER